VIIARGVGGLDFRAGERSDAPPDLMPTLVGRQSAKVPQSLAIERHVSAGMIEQYFQLIALLSRYLRRRPPLALLELEQKSQEAGAAQGGNSWPRNAANRRANGEGRDHATTSRSSSSRVQPG